MIKKIIKDESEFLEKDLQKSDIIGHDYNYNKISYHRYIEYIIDLIEKNEHQKIGILYKNSKELLNKQNQGFENIYIYNRKNNGINTLRLSLLEVKSFEPENKSKTYDEISKNNECKFSQEKKPSRIWKAWQDVKECKTSEYRDEQSISLMRQFINIDITKDNYKTTVPKEIKNDILENFKSKLNLKEISSTNELYKDFIQLLEKQKLKNITLGTVVSNLELEEKIFPKLEDEINKETDEYDDVTCIIVKINNYDYKPIIDSIVAYNNKN